jgi:hypothetical protein
MLAMDNLFTGQREREKEEDKEREKEKEREIKRERERERERDVEYGYCIYFITFNNASFKRNYWCFGTF